MASANKTQLRSLKKALKTGAAPRKQGFAADKLIAPSGAQSECSTLVDFGDEYLEEESAQPGEPDVASLLGSENCAWSRSISTSSTNSDSSRVSDAKHTETAVMLDSDEMSWNLPRDAKRSIPKRILHALAGQ